MGSPYEYLYIVKRQYETQTDNDKLEAALKAANEALRKEKNIKVDNFHDGCLSGYFCDHKDDTDEENFQT